MNRILIIFYAAAILLAFCLTSHAGKPVDSSGVPFANGFPSDPHFNQGNDPISIQVNR